MQHFSTSRYPEVRYTFLGHGGATLILTDDGYRHQCDCGETFPTIEHVEGGYESPDWVRHAKSYRRMLLRLHDEEVELAETLLAALRTANALDGYHARQVGGSYGAIQTALVTTLACAILGSHTSFFFDDTRKIAKRLLEEATDNGENVAYQIDLYNEGVI